MQDSKVFSNRATIHMSPTKKEVFFGVITQLITEKVFFMNSIKNPIIISAAHKQFQFTPPYKR